MKERKVAVSGAVGETPMAGSQMQFSGDSYSSGNSGLTEMLAQAFYIRNPEEVRRVVESYVNWQPSR